MRKRPARFAAGESVAGSALALYAMRGCKIRPAGPSPSPGSTRDSCLLRPYRGSVAHVSSIQARRQAMPKLPNAGNPHPPVPGVPR